MAKESTMHKKKKFTIGQFLNYFFLSALAFICLYPFLNVVAYSFSGYNAVLSGKVTFYPIDITLNAYKTIMKNSQIWSAMWVTIFTTMMGTLIGLILTIAAAYALSRDYLPGKGILSGLILFTMYFSGGLIPTYMVIKNLRLLDSFWVLILPSAMSIWNVIIMMNFIKGLPRAIEEAAFVDGANHWQTLIKVILPMSKPSLASLLLFSMIGHWNAWFDGMFYMNNPNNYPMATYLATQVINNNQTMTNMTPEQLALLSSLSEKTVRSAQMFIAIIPILVVYPFLQKFFVKGITVGSVKE